MPRPAPHAASRCDAPNAADHQPATGSFPAIRRLDPPGISAELLGFHHMCVMRLPGGTESVGVVEHVPNGHEAFDPRRSGLDHLAFVVRSLDELEKWAARLTAADVAHSGVISTPRGAILNFKDRDGIALALFWDGPNPESLS